jgi:hypothetical protein
LQRGGRCGRCPGFGRDWWNFVPWQCEITASGASAGLALNTNNGGSGGGLTFGPSGSASFTVAGVVDDLPLQARIELPVAKNSRNSEEIINVLVGLSPRALEILKGLPRSLDGRVFPITTNALEWSAWPAAVAVAAAAAVAVAAAVAAAVVAEAEAAATMPT